MPDQVQSTVPPPPDDGDHLFRHTFLWRLPDPKTAKPCCSWGRASRT